jgi:hypothetical protein
MFFQHRMYVAFFPSLFITLLLVSMLRERVPVLPSLARLGNGGNEREPAAVQGTLWDGGKPSVPVSSAHGHECDLECKAVPDRFSS